MVGERAGPKMATSLRLQGPFLSCEWGLVSQTQVVSNDDCFQSFGDSSQVGRGIFDTTKLVVIRTFLAAFLHWGRGYNHNVNALQLV